MPKRTGFTLIEIVLVLGLITFATAILITNFASIANRGNSLTTEETLLAAIRKARFIAAKERRVTELRFDKENYCLRVSIDQNSVEEFPLPWNEVCRKTGRTSPNPRMLTAAVRPVHDAPLMSQPEKTADP